MNKEQNNIYAALARAQSTFKEAQKNGYNPHFKSYFSTFEDLVVASRESLTREGLSICQYLDYCFDNDVTYYVTQLQHSSGEIIKGKSRILLKDPTDIQKLGSAISYLKRYAYSSMCGIATTDDDDDGNTISMPTNELLSDKQLAFVKQLLKGNEERESKICSFYNIKSIDQLLKKHVDEVIRRLSQTKE